MSKPRPRTAVLAVIDVLAKVRKPTGNKPVYEADYEALSGLHRLSHELGIAIVVVHHTRKMASDDLMETVNGSYGLVGAVDTVIVMANKGGGAVLDVAAAMLNPPSLPLPSAKTVTAGPSSAPPLRFINPINARHIAALVERGEPMTIT